MRTRLVIDSVHAEVFERRGGVVEVNVSYNLELEDYDEGSVYFRYKVLVSSRAGQVSVSGVIGLHAENKAEADMIRNAVEEFRKNTGNPPPLIANAVLLSIQPLILHIEKEMELPITPITPPSPLKKEQGTSMYQ